MWQFVSWRGKEYGLEQSSYEDERLDPEKATRAAAKHLHDLFNDFGDWYLAMAAYNCGPGRVTNAVERTGYADFWRLRDLGVLPRETTNYVPLILAMTIMAKNPSDYGLDRVDLETPVDFETVKLTAPTSLELIADAAELPVSELRELNPSLLRAVTPAGFEIRLPRGSASGVTSALESVPAERRSSWRMHRVGAGETLASIAKRYRTGATLISAANPSLMDSPAEGDFVIIPASYAENRAHGKASGTLSHTKRTPASLHHHSTPARVKTASLRRASASE
jgi:membrane-bound lytic murein transglycosylase D